MIEEYKESLRKLIAENKISSAIEDITDFSKNNKSIRDEIVLINLRLNELQEKVRKGIINHSEESNTRNKISNSLLDLVNKISDSDLIIYIENSEVVTTLKNEIDKKNKIITKYETEIIALKEQILDLEGKFEKLNTACVTCQGKGYNYKETMEYIEVPTSKLIEDEQLRKKHKISFFKLIASIGDGKIVIPETKKIKTTCEMCNGTGAAE